MTFVIRKGDDCQVKMDYSYARRSQSTVRTLQWKDVAIIDTDDFSQAMSEARNAVNEWSIIYKHSRWQLEGRGSSAFVGLIDICSDTPKTP
jgi:hypothetical protein